MAQDWDIKPRDNSCHACETAFVDRQACHSALIIDKAGYERRDFCEDCWTQNAESVPVFSMWKGIYLAPPPPPEDPTEKETVETLLRRLMEDNDPSKGSIIYLLTVMLERKRMLVERDVQKRDDGTIIHFYEHRKTGETFLIRDPELGLDEIEDLQKEISLLLSPPKDDPAPADDAQGEDPPPADAQVPSGKAVGLKGGFYHRESS